MSAKTVSKGAISTAEQNGEIGTLAVGPEGAIVFSVTHDCGFGNTDVSTTPEQAALLARAVLEAQGWTFNDKGLAVDAKSYPEIFDGWAAIARQVLEEAGWEFGPEEGGDDPVTAVRPGAGRGRQANLEQYALGILASALETPGVGGDIRAQIVSILEGRGGETDPAAN